MAVYVIPRNRNNIWWGGGRGGGSGILDLLGQALIQPMLQRDAAARQYKYDERLANQKHNLDLQMKNAEWDRRDYEANRFIEAYNRDPRRAVGGGEMLAFLPGLGYNGNVSDVAAWALPQMMTIDQGSQKTVAPVYSGGFIGNGETYDMGLSPQEAGTLALAQRKAAFDEQMARDKNAREWYVARNTVRGGGKAADPYAGLNAWGKFIESLGIDGGSGGSGLPGLTVGADGNPVIAGAPEANGNLSGILPLVWRGVGEEYARLYGVNPFPSETQPSATPNPEMDSDVGMITPQPTNDRGVNDMRYNMRLGMNPRGWNRMPVSPGMTQPSAAMVRQHALNRGISDEDALRELTQQ